MTQQPRRKKVVEKVKMVESVEGLLLVPAGSLSELRGAFKSRETLVREGIRELESEHRKEARS
jgi:hypothetical protein